MLWSIVLKAVLFYVLVPKVFLALPQGASLVTQSLVHGLVFAVLLHYIHKYLETVFERFDNPSTKVDPPCPGNSRKLPSGDCKTDT
jgi:hypothetical protein